MSTTVIADSPPVELLESVLVELLGNPTARLTALEVEPIAGEGYSGNQLYRAHLAWGCDRSMTPAGTATWVLKRWLPGGQGERLLGVDRPLEALAWEQGLLRPGALPASVATPIIGARLDPSGDAAWIVMENVSAALREYSREHPLPPSEAVERLRLVLDGLARLHARWERPDRQAGLRGYAGLVPFEQFVWCEAASFATVLGRTPRAGLAPGRVVTDDLRADLQAFLAWLPAGDRPAFERLLYRREGLEAALGAFPRNMIHGDADDRNVGLRHRASGKDSDVASGAPPEVVLIDWEWIAVGPPALDVARLCGSAAAVCDPSQPRPDALFSGELPDYYFERYRAHGGMLVDRDAWRHSFDLAFLVGCLTQVPFAGSMIRHGVAPVIATFERQMTMVLPTVRALDAA